MKVNYSLKFIGHGEFSDGHYLRVLLCPWCCARIRRLQGSRVLVEEWRCNNIPSSVLKLIEYSVFLLADDFHLQKIAHI
jgi:hypothetical protein